MSLECVREQPAWVTNPNLLSEAILNLFIKYELLDDLDTFREIFSAPAMESYWMKCFTHKSIDSEYNNDAFEFYGDKVLGYSFSKYLRKRFRDRLDQASGTLLQAKYMSKQYQAQMSRELGLVELLRYDPEATVSVHVQEDTFEAFAGCLDIIIDEYVVEGAGASCVFNLILALFEKVEIDLDKLDRDDKTMLKEIYDKLGWGKPIYSVNLSDRPDLGTHRAIVVSQVGDTIGVGYGCEKKASFEAAAQALIYLKEEGFDWESADKMKLESNRRRLPEFNKQYARLEKAFDKLVALAKRYNKPPPTEFKLIKVEERREGRGSRYTFVIRMSFSQRGGTIWRDVKQLTGSDSDQTKIDLMKSFADMHSVPQ